MNTKRETNYLGSLLFIVSYHKISQNKFFS